MVDDGSINKANWAFHIKSILQECGMNDVWINQSGMPINIAKITQRITDIYKQSWYSNINNSSKLETYSLFKHEFVLENYLDLIKCKKYRIALSKFRTSSHSTNRDWEIL